MGFQQHASSSLLGLTPGRPEDEVVATVVLMRIRAFPGDRLGSLIDTQGSAVELLQPARTEPQGTLPLSPRQTDESMNVEVARARDDVASWRARDLDVRSVLDERYPSALHEVFNRPPLLFVRGEWKESQDRWAIAVVGTRQPSPEGIRRARQVADELSRASYPVVSGLALGIDTAAHRATLESGGRTLAVLGTGLDHVYPRANQDLAHAILDSGGALISQFFPHQGPAKWTFPMRNAVMSGLSVATVVVEAGETSGARMQARLALEHGRSVFLLDSLVETHSWARNMVETGLYGTQALAVSSTAEILSRLEGDHQVPSEALAV